MGVHLKSLKGAMQKKGKNMQWNILQVSIRCHKVVSDGSAGLLPVFCEILCNIQGHGQSCWVNTWNSFIRKVASGDVELGRVGGHEKKKGIKEWEGDSERETHERAQPFSCSSPSSTGQGSWKRGDYQSTGSGLAWAASALSWTARYTAPLKQRTGFSHTNTCCTIFQPHVFSSCSGNKHVNTSVWMEKRQVHPPKNVFFLLSPTVRCLSSRIWRVERVNKVLTLRSKHIQ